MSKFICFLGIVFISTVGISQKARYFKFIDAETGEVLTEVTLTAMNSSKPKISYQDGVTCLLKHKTKYQYYVSADDYKTRGIGAVEIPEKRDTAMVLMLPTTDLMDQRWEKFLADSTSKLTEGTLISLKNTQVLEKWVADQLLISKATMIHCESLNAANPTFQFLVEFGVDEQGILHFREVEYKEDSPECIYMFRELKRTVMGMHNIRLEDAIEGRKEGRQRLMLPISIGL